MKKSIVFFIFIQLLCINIFAQEYVKVIAGNSSWYSLGYSYNKINILIRAKSVECINVIFRIEFYGSDVDLNISCSDFNAFSTILNKYVQWKKIATENNTTLSKELGSINNVRIITYQETDINDNPKMNAKSTYQYYGKVKFIYNYNDFVVEYPHYYYDVTFPDRLSLSQERRTIEISEYIINNAASSLSGDNLAKLKEEIKYHLDQWEKFK